MDQRFWARQYYAHYKYLLEVIRPKIPISVRRSHPYLYINDNPKTAFFGQPMKMSNLKKATDEPSQGSVLIRTSSATAFTDCGMRS